MINGVKNVVNEIKLRVGVLDLASEAGLVLKRQSRRLYKALCPFHSESKPSLVLYPETNSFCCYGCGAKGDVIAFYAKLKGITNKQATGELVKRFGSVNALLKTLVSQKDYKLEPAIKDGYKPRYSEIYEALKGFCGELDSESLAYLKGRGLSEDTIRDFQLFSIKDYQKTKDFLTSRFNLKDLKDTGLIFQRGRFAFTKNRLMIPVLEAGRIVALRGRFFDKGLDDPNKIKTKTFSYPKYQGTIGTGGRFFNSDVLTGGPGLLYLCEGEFDAMILCQKGVKAIGLFGASSYGPKMLSKLKHFNLVICLDNDASGKRESKRLADMFYKTTGKKPVLNKLPDGVKDVTDFYLRKGGKNG